MCVSMYIYIQLPSARLMLCPYFPPARGDPPREI